MKLPISYKIGFLLAIPTFGAILSITVFHSYLEKSATETAVVNIAGRQRMLAEMMLRYTDMVVLYHQEEDRQPISGFISDFERSLSILEKGEQSKGRFLPAAPAELAGEITEVRKIWTEVKTSLQDIVRLPTGDPCATDAYRRARWQIPLLREESDTLVTAFREASSAARERAAQTLITVAGMNLLLFVAGIWLSRRYVSKPVSLVETGVNRIKNGDYSYRVPITGHDEITSLALAFNEMSSKMKTALDEVAKLSNAVHNMDDVLFITDPNGVIQYVNPAFERISGYSHEEVIGQTPRLWQSGKTEPGKYQELWQTIQTGNSHKGLLLNRRKSGELFYYQQTISILKDENGRVVNFISTGKDVTRDKEIEAQLLQAQKMEAVGTLASGVAHDFNNILAGAVGNLELMKMEWAADSRSEVCLRYADTALLGLERATQLTRRLLNLGRAQTGPMSPVNLREIVDEALSISRRAFGSGIALDVMLAGAGCIVNGDRGQLNQMLLNLLINARDAMGEQGRIRLECSEVTLDEESARYHPGCGPGKLAHLTVSDNGSGIPAEMLPRIFEPFFTTKEPGHGTGLGLAMVFNIVRAHHGCIDVQSEFGRGTTFHICLPKVDPNDLPAQLAGVTLETRTLKGRGERVLIVDDEPILRETGRVMLEKSGYRVETAADGVEALEIIAQGGTPFDLVILDLTMPRMSGRETLVNLMRNNPALKVIISSGFASDEVLEGLLKLGARGGLPKPFRRMELLEIVRSTLDGAP